MEGAFNKLDNQLISDSAATINAGDDNESVLDGPYGKNGASNGITRRRHDDDEATDVLGDYDELASLATGLQGEGDKARDDEEDKELPAHACAYVQLSSFGGNRGFFAN
jgi:regulator of nonsense transcripts 1